jgi:hypothetical protein
MVRVIDMRRKRGPILNYVVCTRRYRTDMRGGNIKSFNFRGDKT